MIQCVYVSRWFMNVEQWTPHTKLWIGASCWWTVLWDDSILTMAPWLRFGRFYCIWRVHEQHPVRCDVCACVSYVWLLIIIDPFEQPTTAAEHKHTQSLDTNVILDYETNFVDVIRWCVSFPEKKTFVPYIHLRYIMQYVYVNEIVTFPQTKFAIELVERQRGAWLERRREIERERVEERQQPKKIRINALRIKLKSERLVRLHTIAKFHLIYFCISSSAHRIWFIFINRAKPYYYFDFVFPISLRAIRIHK